MIVDDFVANLAALPATNTRDAFLSFISERGIAALRRDGGAEHMTASCFVFSPHFDHVLLCFHRKGKFWVQFGGHIEPNDASIADAALREAREESGITELALQSDSIADLDRHELYGGFSCDAHWDVGFVATVETDVEFAASDESEEVRWFACHALPANVATGLQKRIDAVLKANLTHRKPQTPTT